MKGKVFFFGVVLLLMVLPLSALAQSSKPSGEPVKIGVLLPYTGPLTWVSGCAGAIDLGIKEINAAGGVHGRPVEKVVADSEGKADAALVASMLHYGEYTVGEIKEELTMRGLNIRST